MIKKALVNQLKRKKLKPFTLIIFKKNNIRMGCSSLLLNR